MCDICKKNIVMSSYDILDISICTQCLRHINLSNNEVISKFSNWLLELKASYESYTYEIDILKEQFLSPYFSNGSYKVFKTSFNSTKKDINRVKNLIESHTEMVSSIISINELFSNISLLNRLKKSDITEMYRITERAFKTYRDHIKCDRSYTYSYNDIYNLMLIQRYYDIRRYHSSFDLEKKNIKDCIFKNINLTLE